MPRHLAGLAIAGIAIFSSRLAMADVTYDTVDAVQTTPTQSITLTGIVAGQGTPTTRTYSLSGTGTGDAGNRCDRLALLAMSKPGKFQLVMVGPGTSFECKLLVRSP